MSAPMLCKVLSKFATFSGNLHLIQKNCIRCASKKTGGSSRNPPGQPAGKHRRIIKQDGHFVHKGELVMTQLGLRMYPGQNVGIKRDWSLYALTDGNVMITSETLTPYPTSPLYPAVQAGRQFKRKFMHVLPKPQEGLFILKDEV